MNDSLKTAVFFLAALVVLIPAVYLSLPERETFQSSQMINQVLFPELTNVMDVGALAIQTTEKNGTTRNLEVKKTGGQWILSSSSGYPANAQNRMVDVVSALSGLEVLRVVGEDETTRAQCGVLTSEEAPSAEPSELGTRITIRSPQDKMLLDLILGHETEEGSGKYYVRRGGQNPVYVVQMDPSKLSSNFIDWIETDLLKIQPSDIGSLFALDCRLDFQANVDGSPEFVHRGQFELAQKYMENPDWVLISNQKVFGNAMRDVGIPAGQVLNFQGLRRLSQNLADMRICGVQRKPTALRETFLHPESLSVSDDLNRLLQERGFYIYPMNLGQGPINALFSTDGQLHVYSTGGVVYRLFFGGIAGEEAIADLADIGARKFYRYLLLTAELYPDGIGKPNLQELPPKPDEGADAAAKAQYAAILEMNQQEQKIYEEKLAQAREKVEKMNALFADWFYIIPEDVYQQIHLTYDLVFISEEEAQKMKEENEKGSEHHEGEDHHEGAEHQDEADHSEEECHDENCPLHHHHED